MMYRSRWFFADLLKKCSERRQKATLHNFLTYSNNNIATAKSKTLSIVSNCSHESS